MSNLSIYEAKQNLRKKFLEKRKHEQDLSFSSENESIVQNTQQIIDSIKSSQTKTQRKIDKNFLIGLYWPMEKEVDIIKIAINHISALPKIKGNKMYYVHYGASMNSYGHVESGMEKSPFSKLMQPKNEDKVKPDIMIIPGLAFSLYGDRLGFGGGYYDKYVQQNPKAIKIGVCFHDYLCEYLPRGPHDLLVDYVVTDKMILNLK